jgi:hypothetical protein
MPDTPLSQLVLWVSQEITAVWSRLPADQQASWSRLMVHGWLRYLVASPPVSLPTVRRPSREQILAMPVEELKQFVADLERTFARHARGDRDA